MIDDYEVYRKMRADLQRIRFEQEMIPFIAALVESAGGEIRIPRRLFLESPQLIVHEEFPSGDRIYRTVK